MGPWVREEVSRQEQHSRRLAPSLVSPVRDTPPPCHTLSRVTSSMSGHRAEFGKELVKETVHQKLEATLVRTQAWPEKLNGHLGPERESGEEPGLGTGPLNSYF